LAGKSSSTDGHDLGGGRSVGRPGRAARWLRRTLVTLVVLLVLSVLAYALRNQVVAPLLVRALGPTLERSTGLSLTVGNVKGGWFGELALGNVQLEAVEEDGPLRRLALDELHVTYDLPALLRGELEGVRLFNAHGVEVDIDLARAPRAPGDTGTEEPSDGLDLPSVLPHVHVDGSVRVTLSPSQTINVSDLTLSARPTAAAPDRSPFELKANVLGTSVTLRGHWSDGGHVEADLAVPSMDLERVARALLPELAPDPAGTVTIDAHTVLDVLVPVNARTSFSIEGRSLDYNGYGATSLTARGGLEALVLQLDTLSVDAGENSILSGELRLPLFPKNPTAVDAQQPWRDLLAAARARVDCVLRDVPALVPPKATGDGAGDALAGEVPEHELRLTLQLEDNQLTIERGEIDTPGCSFGVRRGTLPLDREGELDVDLEADFTDLSELGALLGAPDWGGRMRGDVVLRGTWSTPRGIATLRGDEVLLAGAELGNVSLAAHLTETELRVSSLSADGAFGHVDLSGGWDLQRDELNARLDLAIGDSILAPAGLAGPLTIALELDGASDDVRFDAQAGSPALIGSATGAAELDLARNRASVRFETFTIDGGDGGLTLLHPTRITVEPTGVTIEDLACAGPAGSVAIDLVHARGQTCGTVQLHDFVPPAILRPWLPGEVDFAQLDATVELERDTETLAADVELVVDRLTGFGFAPLDLALDATLGGGWLEVRKLQANDVAGLTLSLEGRAPLAPLATEPLPDGALSWTGTVLIPDALALPGVPADGALRQASLEANLELAGTWAAVTGTAHVAAQDVVVEAVELGVDREDPKLGPLALEAKLELGEAIRIVEASAVGPGGIRATIEARVETVADVRAWLAGEIEELLAAPLDLEANARVADLSRFEGVSTAVRTLEGAAEMVVKSSGTLAKRTTRGHLKLTKAALRTNTPLPAIAELNAALTLTDGAFDIESVAGELGGAPFQLDGRAVLWPQNGDGDSDPTIDLVLSGENLLLYRMSGVRVRADSDLTIRGPLHSPLIAGTVALRDGRYVQDFELIGFGRSRTTPQGRRGLQIFSLRDAPLSDLRFDVAVTSATPFRIDTNLTQGKVRPELRLRGTGAVPLVEGTIYIDPTKFKLPSGPLYVRSGTVVFDESDPFLPTLDLRADTRLRGYDIYLRINGQYDEPTIDLTSSPSLPADELLLLLLTGTPPTAAGRTDEDYKQGAQDVLFYLVRDLFGTISDSDEESWADRVEVTTGGEITRSGSQTTRGSVRLFDSVFSSRDSIYVIGERDVYDKINFGLQFLFRLP
jgi:hypothetical protein